MKNTKEPPAAKGRGGRARKATASKSSERSVSHAAKRARPAKDPLAGWTEHADRMTAELDDLEARRKDGKLHLPDGDTLDVTNLQKVFWPAPKYTGKELYHEA